MLFHDTEGGSAFSPGKETQLTFSLSTACELNRVGAVSAMISAQAHSILLVEYRKQAIRTLLPETVIPPNRTVLTPDVLRECIHANFRKGQADISASNVERSIDEVRILCVT